MREGGRRKKRLQGIEGLLFRLTVVAREYLEDRLGSSGAALHQSRIFTEQVEVPWPGKSVFN